MSKLNPENPFFEFMGNVGDLILLNLLFIVCCIPVVTIGAAQTAMYQVMMRRVRKKSNYAVREFITGFKNKFKNSTKLWIVFLLTGALLIFDVLYMGRSWNVIGIGVGCLIFIWSILFSYVFPLEARFDNTFKNTLKNAAFMSVRHFPYTVAIVILNCIPVVAFIAGGAIVGLLTPIFLVIGFSIVARVNSIMFEKIFANYGG